MDTAAVVGDLDARLRAAANPDRAPAERAYLKSDLTHLGAGVPATRRAVKVTLAEHGPVDHDDLVAIIEALWAATVYEHRLAAVGALTASTDPLSVADAAWLEPRAHRAAGLTVREAAKPLPEHDRQRVLAARAAR